MQTSLYTNIAFISYKREGEEWAKWFQKKLEHYKLPTEIRKKNPDLEFSAHPRHVFTDTTDQSGGVLAKAIKEGLGSYRQQTPSSFVGQRMLPKANMSRKSAMKLLPLYTHNANQGNTQA